MKATVFIRFVILNILIFYHPIIAYAFNDEFVISTEPSPSQFYRNEPQLFFATNNSFFILWEDWRRGEYGGYAQQYDEHVNPIDKNFSLLGHYQMAIMPDHTIFSLTKRSEYLDDWWVEYQYMDGQILQQNGTTSPIINIFSTQMPDCLVGWMGRNAKVSYSDNLFWVMIYNDRYLIRNFYDIDGNLISSYTVNPYDWSHYDDNFYRIYYNGACQPNNYSVLTWFKYLEENYNQEYDVDSFQATFFTDCDSIICDEVLIDSIKYNTQGYFPNISHVITLDPEHYLFLWFHHKTQSLKYVIYDLYGNSSNQVQEIVLATFSDSTHIVEEVTCDELYLSQWYDNLFDIIIGYTIYYNHFQYCTKIYQFTFNDNGEFIDSTRVSNDDLILYSDHYWRLNDQSFLAPQNMGNSVILNAYTSGEITNTIKVNDDTAGANQKYATIIPLNQQRVLVSWSDERFDYSRIVDMNGNCLNDPKKSSGLHFLQLSDSVVVNYNESKLTYYRIDDWSIIKVDTIKFNNQYQYINEALAIKFKEHFVLFLPGHIHSFLQSYDLKGSKLSEVMVDDVFHHPAAIAANNQTSFWLLKQGKIQLYSMDLSPLIALIEINPYLQPITSNKAGTLVCTYMRYPSTYKICMIDSAGTIFAEYPFPLLSDSRLQLNVIPIDTSNIACMWTEEKNVYLRIFNSQLQPYDDAFMIHTAPSYYQDYGNACVIDGMLYCIWSDSRNSGHGYDIYGRLLDIKTITQLQDYQSTQRNSQNFTIQQNYPNPFNSRTVIRYSLPRKEKVTITIFNNLGETVMTLIEDIQPMGEYTINWDGRSKEGHKVCAGVYFYRIQAGSLNKTKKMILLL